MTGIGFTRGHVDNKRQAWDTRDEYDHAQLHLAHISIA